jgi:hypothetical protein
MIERLYNIFIMLVGVLMYSFAITSLSNIVVKTNKKEKQYNKHMELLEEIKDKYNIGVDVYRMLNRYLSYDLKINKIDKKLLLNELPQQLKYNLILQMYENPIQNLNFFEDTPNEFIFKTVTLLRQLKLFKSDYLIRSGHYLDEMYFVKRGRLLVLLPVNKTKKIKILHVFKNEHFGEVYMCKRMRCPVDVKVCSKLCELWSLSKADFIELNEEFPNIIQKHIKRALMNTTKMEWIAKGMLIKMNRDFAKSMTINIPSVLSPIEASDNNRSEVSAEDEKKSTKKSLYHHKSHSSSKNMSADNNSSFVKQNSLDVDNQHLQLIDFNTADINNAPIIEEGSSVYSEHTITESSLTEQEVIQNKTQMSKQATIMNDFTLNDKNTNQLLFRVNTHTSQGNRSPIKGGQQININYNINISNNVNFGNDYFSQILNKQSTFVNDQAQGNKDITKNNSTLYGLDNDSISISIRKDIKEAVGGLENNIKETIENIKENNIKENNIKENHTKEIHKKTTLKENNIKETNIKQNHSSKEIPIKTTLKENNIKETQAKEANAKEKKADQNNSKDNVKSNHLQVNNIKDNINELDLANYRRSSGRHITVINNANRKSQPTIMRIEESFLKKLKRTDTLNDSLKNVYEMNENTPELKNVKNSNLFGLFMDKVKQRNSASPCLRSRKSTKAVPEPKPSPVKQPKPSQKLTEKPPQTRQSVKQNAKQFLSRFSILRTEDVADLPRQSVQPKRNSNLSNSAINYTMSPERTSRRSSMASIQRLSEHHFNDIIENMKKDALVKKNPNGFLFKGVGGNFRKSSNNLLVTNNGIREQQIDRVTDLFENLLTALLKIKTRKLNNLVINK